MRQSVRGRKRPSERANRRKPFPSFLQHAVDDASLTCCECLRDWLPSRSPILSTTEKKSAKPIKKRFVVELQTLKSLKTWSKPLTLKQKFLDSWYLKPPKDDWNWNRKEDKTEIILWDEDVCDSGHDVRRLRRKAAPRRPANGDDRRQHGFLHYAQIPQVPFRRWMFPQKYDFQRLLIQIFSRSLAPFLRPSLCLAWSGSGIRWEWLNAEQHSLLFT